jgi:hypothetical protein
MLNKKKIRKSGKEWNIYKITRSKINLVFILAQKSSLIGKEP